MSVQQSVALNVRKWRLRRVVSVSALARAAGVSKLTISEIERESGESEIFLTTMAAGAERDSVCHGADVIEHALVVDGRLEIEIADSSPELGQGDLISLGAHQPHRYRPVGGSVPIVGIHHYPRGRTVLAAPSTDGGAGV